MKPNDVLDLLDCAETDLAGVSRFLLAPEIARLPQSQKTLERLIEDLQRVKGSAQQSGQNWPPAVRERLKRFGASLRRVQAFGEALSSAVQVRIERSGVVSQGYSTRGCENRGADFNSIALDC